MHNLALKMLFGSVLILISAAASCNPKNITLASQADSYYQQQDWLKAAEAYQKVTDSEAQNHLAWYRLADALIELNDASPALQALDNAAKSPQLPAITRSNYFLSTSAGL